MNTLKALVVGKMVDRFRLGAGAAPEFPRATPVTLDQIENVLKHVHFPKSPRLLGTSLKVEKNVKEKTLTAVMYLAASTRSVAFGGRNLCPHASPGCAAACLGHTSGRLAMNEAQNAQVWKTLLFVYCRDLFISMLNHEIGLHKARARRKGLHASVRLNGSSDVAWERVAPHIFEEHRDVTFYDYTKDKRRALASVTPYERPRFPSYAPLNYRGWPPNYHLTFSRSEDTGLETIRALVDAGVNVAVVFRPESGRVCFGSWHGMRVIDGDRTDYRAADPTGVIVGLSVKGNVKDETGFYV